MQRSHLFTHVVYLHALVLRECLRKLFEAILHALTDGQLIQVRSVFYLSEEIGSLLISHGNRLVGMRMDIVVEVVPEEF